MAWHHVPRTFQRAKGTEMLGKTMARGFHSFKKMYALLDLIVVMEFPAENPDRVSRYITIRPWGTRAAEGSAAASFLSLLHQGLAPLQASSVGRFFPHSSTLNIQTQ